MFVTVSQQTDCWIVSVYHQKTTETTDVFIYCTWMYFHYIMLWKWIYSSRILEMIFKLVSHFVWSSAQWGGCARDRKCTRLNLDELTLKITFHLFTVALAQINKQIHHKSKGKGNIRALQTIDSHSCQKPYLSQTVLDV